MLDLGVPPWWLEGPSSALCSSSSWLAPDLRFISLNKQGDLNLNAVFWGRVSRGGTVDILAASCMVLSTPQCRKHLPTPVVTTEMSPDSVRGPWGIKLP